MLEFLEKTDPEIAQAVRNELKRIRNGVELIPSENFVSMAVLEAMGTIFTNKYSEGYPHKRYYGGNEFVDVVEELAINRAKKLFGAEHVNVQPYSGSPANMACFFALLERGDIFMGLDLSCGGHLTHGSPVNFSGKWYRCIPYAVDRETELIDMDEVRKIALKAKPKLILSGLTCYPRTLDFKAFQEICEEVGAYHMSDISHIAGLVAAGVHPSPVPFADVVTTTTHKTLRGPRGAMIMCKEEHATAIDKAVFPGIQGGPHDHITAAKAVAFHEDLQPEFKDYARQIVKNAKVLAEELMSLGIKLVSNGTDNHLMLIDLTKKNLTGKGKAVQNALERAGIFVNKNTIPYEPATPFNPSGIRLGTPAITTRGFKESEMKVIAEGIATVIDNYEDESKIKKVKEDILELCKEFPLYPELGE
ncbi:MAG: serine hydroxymethyltransferase [Candidatus Aenigmatarchaeota archaeon]|nr:MAG: serine hydroxymethyltransferase [Candidatus Aenigmarchaeota archaeon ex4484_14]RLI97647.1 MAG: serine hydroxymethyltransferase [Candidatus Aenigmarchaeota archaeon]